jgi:hypothetical protein
MLPQEKKLEDIDALLPWNVKGAVLLATNEKEIQSNRKTILDVPKKRKLLC